MLTQVAPVVSPQIEVSERFALVPVSVITSLTAKVRPSAVIVYVALASFADRNGVCWPSRKTLAAMTNLSVDHISHATSELRDAGFLTKEVGNNGLTVYRLTVVPLRKSPEPAERPPVRANNPPCSYEQTETDQGTDQKQERRQTAAVKASAVVSLSEIQQKPLPDDWTLPDDFRERSRRTRPDLTSRLDTIAENFADYHRSKGTMSRCWASEWDRWIRRERRPGEMPSRLPVVRRYPVPGQDKTLPKAVIDASIQRFQEQCREMGLEDIQTKVSPLKVSPLKESLKALGVRLRS